MVGVQGGEHAGEISAEDGEQRGRRRLDDRNLGAGLSGCSGVPPARSSHRR